MIRFRWCTMPAVMKPALGKPAFAAALSLLLAAELLLPGPAAPPAREAPAIPAATPDQGADAAILQWGGTILARPLFDASRRPAAQAGPETGFTLPRLSAIIVIGGTRSAIFAAPGQKPMLVAEGGEIGPYRLTSIAPDKVEMLGPDGTVTLHPQRMPAAPAPAAN